MKLTVLAVDDSLVITEMIKDAFELEGYRVLVAADGVEAIKTALAENPDLIIADISMPGMDGWEPCSQIRSHPYTSFIPFIFLTAKVETPDRIKGLQMGADDYLTKPFEMEELLARVKLIFQRMLKTQEAIITRGPEGLSGTTQDLSLTDLIQLFAINQKTGLLQISRGAELTGRLAFLSGRIINASYGSMKGLKALYRMLSWPDARFQVLPLTDLTQDISFPEKVESILMESARQRDEIERLKVSHPLAGKIICTVKATDYKPANPLEAEVISNADHGAGFQDLLDMSALPDLEVYKTIANLIDNGTVEVGE